MYAITMLSILGVMAGAIVVGITKNAETKKKGIIFAVACVGILLLVVMCSGGGSGGGREMGKCWICGQSGSFRMDGSYYCFKHYNQRMSGKIG